MPARPARVVVAVLILVALVLTGLPATAAGPTPRSATAAPAAPVQRTAGPALHIGTFNIRANTSLATFRRGVEALRRHVDVAGLQEIGLNAKRIYLNSSRTWGSYHAPRIQQNPVIWNRRVFDFLGASGPRLARACRLGHELPGSGQVVKESYASVVHLRHRASGRRISVVNVHLVHGAVRAGRPWPGRPRTFRLFRAQVAGLARVVRAERAWGHVFVLGDFNVGYAQDKREGLARLPYRQLTHLGLTSMWKGSKYVGARRGTHRNALLDQVWSRARARHRTIVRSIHASDHYPAVATYPLRRVRGYVPRSRVISIADATGFEGDLLRFEVTGDLSSGSVGIEVSDGTATRDLDYWEPGGIESGDPHRTWLEVQLLTDGLREPDETFTVRLVAPANVTIGRGVATGTILDTD